MMKTAHPDAGGSTNEAETINQYYDILKKYANYQARILHIVYVKFSEKEKK